MEQEQNRKQKLVIDGNAFYEIDLECVERRRKAKEEMERKKGKRREQGA